MKSPVSNTCCIVFLVLVFVLSCVGCGSGGSAPVDSFDTTDTGDTTGTGDSSDNDDSAQESDIYFSALTHTSDWTEATHEKRSTEEIMANLDFVFDTSSVQTMRIVIEPENWALMNQNLEELAHELGHSQDFNSIDSPFFRAI